MVRFGVLFGLMISLAVPVSAAVDDDESDDPPGELEESKAEKEKDAKELETELDGDAFVGPEACAYARDAQRVAVAAAAKRTAARRLHASYEARGPPV